MDGSAAEKPGSQKQPQALDRLRQKQSQALDRLLGTLSAGRVAPGQRSGAAVSNDSAAPPVENYQPIRSLCSWTRLGQCTRRSLSGLAEGQLATPQRHHPGDEQKVGGQDYPAAIAH